MTVFVLDKRGRALMPCTEKRARLLLERSRARVVRVAPFTIRLVDRLLEDSELQLMRLKLDPGSKVTGVAVTLNGQQGTKAVLLADIVHRTEIKSKLDARRALRRGRRQRKTRYRKPRFLNRRRTEGWLAPSLEARVNQVMNTTCRMMHWLPIQAVSMELVRFDTQALDNPEIQGVEYQQGELLGYEVREYLLTKFGRTCVYCKGKRGDVHLEVEHIIPRSRGGSNRVSNLTIACHTCNQEKGNLTAEEYGHPEIGAKAKAPLKDAAFVNATRWRLYHRLQETRQPVECGTGGRTKMQRTQHELPKEHYYDALCVGASTPSAFIGIPKMVLTLTVKGRGSRRMVLCDRYGFPRGKAKAAKRIHGFQTGDRVRADVPTGKYAGTWCGRVSIRANDYFDIKGPDGVMAQGVSWKHMRVLQRADGWHYGTKPTA